MLVRSVIPRWVGEQTHSYCRCITSVYTHRLARPYISSRYARTMALIRDCWWCGYYRAETEGWHGLAMVNGATTGRGGYHRFLIPRGAHPRFPLSFHLPSKDTNFSPPTFSTDFFYASRSFGFSRSRSLETMTSVGGCSISLASDRTAVPRNFPLKGDRIGDWRRASETGEKCESSNGIGGRLSDRPVALA